MGDKAPSDEQIVSENSVVRFSMSDPVPRGIIGAHAHKVLDVNGSPRGVMFEGRTIESGYPTQYLAEVMLLNYCHSQKFDMNSTYLFVGFDATFISNNVLQGTRYATCYSDDLNPHNDDQGTYHYDHPIDVECFFDHVIVNDVTGRLDQSSLMHLTACGLGNCVVFQRDDDYAFPYINKLWVASEIPTGLRYVKRGSNVSIFLKNSDLHKTAAIVLGTSSVGDRDLIMHRSKGLTVGGYTAYNISTQIVASTGLPVFSRLNQDDWAVHCHSQLIQNNIYDYENGYSWGVNEVPMRKVVIPSLMVNETLGTYSEDYKTVFVPVSTYEAFEKAIRGKHPVNDIQHLLTITQTVFVNYSEREILEFLLLGISLLHSVTDQDLIDQTRETLGYNSHTLTTKVDSIWLSFNFSLFQIMKYAPDEEHVRVSFVLGIGSLFLGFWWFITLGVLVLLNCILFRFRYTKPLTVLVSIGLSFLAYELVFYYNLLILVLFGLHQAQLPKSRCPELSVRDTPSSKIGVKLKDYTKLTSSGNVLLEEAIFQQDQTDELIRRRKEKHPELGEKAGKTTKVVAGKASKHLGAIHYGNWDRSHELRGLASGNRN